VHAGQKYLSDDVSKQLAFQLIGDRADFSPVESLSDRELQVLCLIANGAKTSEIGDELCLSVKTISTYRGRVLDKLGYQLKPGQLSATLALQQPGISTNCGKHYFVLLGTFENSPAIYCRMRIQIQKSCKDDRKG
jgi:DNA-binding CsgD family transcriptional regulator